MVCLPWRERRRRPRSLLYSVPGELTDGAARPVE